MNTQPDGIYKIKAGESLPEWLMGDGITADSVVYIQVEGKKRIVRGSFTCSKGVTVPPNVWLDIQPDEWKETFED